jgi:hypothetical protein
MCCFLAEENAGERTLFISPSLVQSSGAASASAARTRSASEINRLHGRSAEVSSRQKLATDDLLVRSTWLARLSYYQRDRVANLSQTKNHRQDMCVILQDRVGFQVFVEAGDGTGFDDIVDGPFVGVEVARSFD